MIQANKPSAGGGGGAALGAPFGTPNGVPCASTRSIAPAISRIAATTMAKRASCRAMRSPRVSRTFHHDLVGELRAQVGRLIELLVRRHLQQALDRCRIHVLRAPERELAVLGRALERGRVLV